MKLTDIIKSHCLFVLCENVPHSTLARFPQFILPPIMATREIRRPWFHSGGMADLLQSLPVEEASS